MTAVLFAGLLLPSQLQDRGRCVFCSSMCLLIYAAGRPAQKCSHRPLCRGTRPPPAADSRCRRWSLLHFTFTRSSQSTKVEPWPETAARRGLGCSLEVPRLLFLLCTIFLRLQTKNRLKSSKEKNLGRIKPVATPLSSCLRLGRPITFPGASRNLNIK
jgi:hypothetical protein